MITKTKNTELTLGMKAGIPIAIGYFACALTLGIMAGDAGLSIWEAVLASLCLNASAGEFAFFTVITEGGSLITMMLMEAIANARYALMSCVVGQKADKNLLGLRRFAVGFDLTDELFSAAVTRDTPVNLSFYGGMMLVSMPGWALGTAVGFLIGNVLPAFMITAFTISLLGMFINAIVPAAKKQPFLWIPIVLTMGASYGLSKIPRLAAQSGIRTVIVTIVIALLFAILFPIKNEEENA